MPDDRDTLLDWRLAKGAVRGWWRADGDRQDRAEGQERRSSSVPNPKMLAFPGARRVGEIRRLVEQMCRLPFERGEAHLKQQLRNKAAAMRRRGFTEREIAREIAGLEAAVRGELWRRAFGTLP